MACTRRSHFNRIAVLASGAMLLLAGSATAQTVPIFDDAPSIEQLRSIMVPKATPGTGRSIIIQRPDIDRPSAVQRVSTETPTTFQSPATRAKAPSAPIVKTASVPGPKAPPAAEAASVVFHVNFAFNSAVMPNSARNMIDQMGELMKESPKIRVRVEGHTDAVGSVSYNISLSERRALSVGEYLVKQGIDPSRLELIGKGMAEPLTSNRYDPTNRRVQFVRIG